MARRAGRAFVQARRLRDPARRDGLHRRDVGLSAGHPAHQRQGLQTDRGALSGAGLAGAGGHAVRAGLLRADVALSPVAARPTSTDIKAISGSIMIPIIAAYLRSFLEELSA